MKVVKLGSSGLKVSRLGLGCMGMSEFYGKQTTEADCIHTIHHAITHGVTFLDTADMYGPFTNEVLVGKAIKDRRDRVIISTKFGIVRGEKGEWLGMNGRPDYVKKSCEGSLKRLGVDYIDLYFQHRIDPKVPIEETIGAMKQLVEEGKVRYIGVSEAAPETIRKAHHVHPLSALQTEYSLWSREPESELLDLVRELGIGFVAYSPMGRGFLTGRYKSIDELPADDFRRTHPRFMGENFQKNLDLEKKIEEIAQSKRAKPGQIALAWLLAQGDDIVPIPGTTKTNHLKENIESVHISLSNDELKALDEVFPLGKSFGDRYADMSTVNH